MDKRSMKTITVIAVLSLFLLCGCASVTGRESNDAVHDNKNNSEKSDDTGIENEDPPAFEKENADSSEEVEIDKETVIAKQAEDTEATDDLLDDNLATLFENAGIEADIPDLSSAIASAEGLGEDAVCGACIATGNINDEKFMALVKKHFNAVTLENELKLDCMLGYSNDAPPKGSIHEEELNGETIQVPTLDHSRAEAILDRILEWNLSHPDHSIKVRGHVLVWHSQAPEWFFHENYDKKNAYVSKEEMDRRLEWYIMSMLTHYTGDDSRYRGLFYAWDVVNEAVSDASGSYRTDVESGNDQLTDSIHPNKSSWWKIYGSNEFIINAFRYANTYAAADVKLFYNDYNECSNKKIKGIEQLLNDVKSAEGTRIDGMGMQGHYTVFAPTALQVEAAARRYAAIVDTVQITEMDVKASQMYDGSPEGLTDELDRQAGYYLSIYNTLKKLDSEEGTDISGFTVWGVTDNYSWLQLQNNNPNGILEVPLLFDKDYRAKPAFFALTQK